MQEIKMTSSRDKNLARLSEDTHWDIVIIGAGSTGTGIAVDAASRGFKTLLLDANDFASGASGNSSKLIANGPFCPRTPALMKSRRKELVESKYLAMNAPHLVTPVPLIIPCYKDFERPLYYSSLLLGILMSYGGYKIGCPSWLRVEEVIRKLPEVKVKGLKGGVSFTGLCFDDARLIVSLIRTAEKYGALALNYMQVVGFERDAEGNISVVKCEDKATGKQFNVKTKMVFNAAGTGADSIRAMVYEDAKPLFTTVKNKHVVIEKRHFEGEAGLFCPMVNTNAKFSLPWNNVVELGQLSAPCKTNVKEPEKATDIVSLLKPYFEFSIEDSYVISTFEEDYSVPNKQLGTRPKSEDGYTILTEFRNLITVVGGNWSTYRARAEEAMAYAVDAGLIYKRPCSTMYMSIEREHHFDPEALDKALGAGKDVAEQVLDYARFCKEHLYALCAEDVLYRRLRIGQMNSKTTEELMPKVAEIFG